MLDHVTKIKKACVALLGALLCTGAVLLSSTVPVFASPNANSWNGGTGYVQHGEISSLLRSSDDVYYYKVPIYFYFNENKATYILGSVYFRNPLTFYLGTTSTTILPSYYESIESDDITSAYNPSSGNITVNYNDCFNTGELHLIGYFIFYIPSAQSNSVLLVSHNGTASVSYSGTLYYSNYADNMMQTIVDAINYASDINDIYTALSTISNNTALLSSVLSTLQNNHTALYTLIQNVWNTEQAILSVNQQTYQAVLGILAHLNNQYGVQESQAEQIADDINQGLGNLAHDMEVVQPSAVADLADSYISQIDTSYNSQVFNFLSNNYIILMLCLVFAFSILSYMLYGGQ